MKRGVSVLIFGMLVSWTAQVYALGEEHFGNEPLNELNYDDWKGIVPLVNHPSRVYHTWVNGNEHFYYRGDVSTLNRVLNDFTRVDAESHEVILRPGPGAVRSFDGKEISFDWALNLRGGISRHTTTLPLADKIWPKSPRITIYINMQFDLDKLQAPKGLSLVTVDELSQRGRQALSSNDSTVRGWGAGELARIDRFSTENASAIAKLLDDKDSWVRLNAAGALAYFGKKAESALPALREHAETATEELRARIKQTIQEIEDAPDTATAEAEHKLIVRKIAKYLESR